MHFNINTPLFLSVLSSAIGAGAMAIGVTEDTANLSRATTDITASQIQAIAPKSASCANAPAEGECATADVAAGNLTASFECYQVTSCAEKAAVIGLLAFESGEFQYNRNHFPGTPGQGTRNMQSPEYNAKYAQSIPEISDKVTAANGDVAQILDLLLSEGEYDFGSGAWFLTTQCSKEVREQLQSGSEQGWEAYITQCVGTEANADRKAYWQKAVEVL